MGDSGEAPGTGGKTYAARAGRPRPDDCVMQASFLRASLFTSVAFGVAALAVVLGIVLS